MPRGKKASLTAAVSQELKSNFDLGKFKEKKMLNSNVKFKDQQWIFSRIDSLYTIRNRVAHNSGYLTSDELKSVETYCREIIKQIDQYIKK